MGTDSDQVKPTVCATCFGARKVFRFGIPPGERVTKQFWTTCPRCTGPERVVPGP